MAIRRAALAVAVIAAGVLTITGPGRVGPMSPALGQSCSAAYPDFCIPPSPDVNCPQLPEVNFTALQPDPHGLDADNDGIACEDPARPRYPTTTTTLGPTSTTSVTLIFPTSTSLPQTRIVTIGPADNLPTGLLDRTG